MTTVPSPEPAEDDATPDPPRARLAALEAAEAATQRGLRSIAVQLAIARVLSESVSSVQAAATLMRGVCQALGWTWAALWQVDPVTMTLTCTQHWRAPSADLDAFEALSLTRPLDFGAGLPGDVWKHGRPLWVPDVLHHDNFPRVAAAAANRLHAGFAAPVTVDGETVAVVEFLGHAIEEPDDDLLTMLGAASELLGRAIERDRIIAALRDSTAHQAATLETALDSIIAIDIEQRVIQWNPAAERTFGYGHAEALGRTLAELIIPPDLRDLHQRGFARHLATGRNTILGQRVRVRGMRSDGSEFPIELAITRSDVHGRTFFTAYLRDITQQQCSEDERVELLRREQAARRVAEEASHRSNQLLALAAAFSRARTPTEVAEVVITQGVTVLGASAGRVSVLSADGSTLSHVGAIGYTPELVARWQQVSIDRPAPMAEVVRTGRPLWITSREELLSRFPIINAVATADASAFAALPLLVDERPVGALGLRFAEARTFREEDRAFMQALAHHCAQALERARLFAAEQEARDRAEAAVHLRNEFLSVASHELKTPLTSIKAAGQLLVRRLQPGQVIGDDAPRLAGRLLEQVQRLENLVSDLLDASHIQRGHVELRPERLELTEFARQILERFEHAPERNDAHRLVLEAATPVNGWWDPLRIDQVLTNLISNALKYSPEGGVVRVRVDGDDDGVTLAVDDQGIGIGPEERAQLFQPFGRVGWRKSQIPGSGLGLYITRQIVEQYGGTIDVESRVGAGSKFTVRLPRQEPPR